MPAWTVLVEAAATAVLTTLLVLAAAGAVLLLGARRLLRGWTTHPPAETLMQLPLSLSSTRPDRVLFIELRAETGDMVLRPMGSGRPAANLDVLSLVPAQLEQPPATIDEDVDLSTELCPHARRPVRLALPVYISGMGYGLALSREAKLALALGSALAGTAINSGEGPVLPEEPVLAYRWFYQVGRGEWSHRPDAIRRADMVEIHVGQGSESSAALTKPPHRLTADVRRIMGLRGDQPAIVRGRLHWRGRPVDLRELVTIIRASNPYCPVGVKLAASDALEAELEEAVRAGVDFITLDGEEAGTGDAPVSLNESVGIPLLHALVRADRWLRRLGVRGRVTLIASGGLRDPADFIKILALGADALAIGSAALVAIAHRQFEPLLPAPPNRLVTHGAAPAGRFNTQFGAHSLANYLESCRKEMQLLLRTMGKRSLSELNRADLTCTDLILARHLGVRCSLEPVTPAELALRRIHWGAARLADRVDGLAWRARAAADAGMGACSPARQARMDPGRFRPRAGHGRHGRRRRPGAGTPGQRRQENAGEHEADAGQLQR